MAELSSEDQKIIEQNGYFLGFDEMDNLPNYKARKHEHEINKRSVLKIDGREYFVHTPELAAILFSDKVKATIHMRTTEVYFNGRELIKDYVKGYQKGEIFFDDNFGIDPGVLYGTNAEYYIKGLHENFYHTKHKRGNPGFFEGWGAVTVSYPLVIKPTVIEDYGYFSGIVSKVQQLNESHKPLFEKWNICDRTHEANMSDSTGDITAPAFALFCSIVLEAKIIIKQFDESKESYCSRVSEYFKLEGVVKPKQARKTFAENMDIKKSDRYLKEVELRILPLISQTEKNKIQYVINHRTNQFN